MIKWLLKKYLKNNLSILIQLWPLSKRLDAEIYFDNELICSSHIDHIDQLIAINEKC